MRWAGSTALRSDVLRMCCHRRPADVHDAHLCPTARRLRMRPSEVTRIMKTMTEIALTVGWTVSFVVVLALQVVAERSGGWGADPAASRARYRSSRPYVWGFSAVGLMCLLGLLGLIITRDH